MTQIGERPSTKTVNRRALVRTGAATIALGSVLLASRSLGRPDSRIRKRNDLIWGVNGHPVLSYPGLSLEQQLDTVQSLGFTHYRIDLRGDGSPADLTKILKLAKKKRITILPILHPHVDMDKDSEDALYTAAYKLGKDMSHHYRDEVRIWELSNELENYAILQPCEMRDDGTQYPCDWGPAGGVEPLEYYGPRWKKVSAVLKGLSEGVATGEPMAMRAIGTAGWGHLGAFERIKSDGISWEITVWHDYQQVSEDYLKNLAAYGKPIWVTEFNAGGGGFETPERNAEMLTERIAYYRSMRKKYDLAAAFVYELIDETYWGDTFEARQGLYALDKHGDSWKLGSIKPSGEAVRAALRGL